jgi:hypothetical protein
MRSLRQTRTENCASFRPSSTSNRTSSVLILRAKLNQLRWPARYLPPFLNAQVGRSPTSLEQQTTVGKDHKSKLVDGS